MDGVHHLLTSSGFDLLAQMPPYDANHAEITSRRLRAEGWQGDLVAAALTQQRLRQRAEEKLGKRAASMLFTAAGAQQATRQVVAQLHAQRFVEAGSSHVADITCGIGVDALALAEAGIAVTAVDIDEVTAACARFNTADYPNVTVMHGDGMDLDWKQFDGIFADPARRSTRGRTFNPDDYSPPLDAVLSLRRKVPALGVKVAPGIGYEALPEDVHAQWISVDGSVVEAGLWFAPLADAPGRSALVIRGEQMVSVSAGSDPRAPAPMLDPKGVGRYLYEPDGAVIRSGALANVAQLLEAAPVSMGIAYLTGDRYVDTPLAQAFEIVETMPLKQFRAYAANNQIGTLEVLKRGVDAVPDKFRKGLKLRGSKSATVVLTRLLGKHSAVVVKRVRK